MDRDTACECDSSSDVVETDDPIYGVYCEWLSVRHVLRTVTNDVNASRLDERLEILENKLCRTMATTWVGLHCQLTWLHETLPHGLANDGRELILLDQVIQALYCLQKNNTGR